MLKTEAWKPSEIWVNPEVRKRVESEKPKPQKKIAKPDLPKKLSLPHSPGVDTPKDPRFVQSTSRNSRSVQDPLAKQTKKSDPYPWFKPTGSLVKHVDIDSLKRVEAWRKEVAAEIEILSHNKKLAPFIPPIDKVLGVIHRESKGRPWEKGDVDEETDLPKSFGLTQMQVATANKFLSGMTESTLLNGKTNIKVALRELTDYHKRAAHGDPSKISEFTLNVAVGAHNVGKAWLYKRGFRAERKEMLDRKVANYLREVDFVAKHLRFVGPDGALLASGPADPNRRPDSKP